jgi:hypothetical protein
MVHIRSTRADHISRLTKSRWLQEFCARGRNLMILLLGRVGELGQILPCSGRFWPCLSMAVSLLKLSEPETKNGPPAYSDRACTEHVISPSMFPIIEPRLLQGHGTAIAQLRAWMKSERLHSQKRPEKGKPFERAGRKAAGLNHEKTRDRVAGPPGDSNASIGRACLVNHRRRTYYDRCYSLVEN